MRAPVFQASLVPLHEAAEVSYALPAEGQVTVGRRATNGVICRDVAVSGTHCIVRRLAGIGAGWYEVEDCSTNGTHVNDVRLEKGQKARLLHGDLVALTRPEAGVAPVQFRFEEQQCRAEQVATAPGSVPVTSQEQPRAPATAPAAAPAVGAKPAFVTMATTAEGFAQDLLVQEQQSKAKITGELLLVRRKLDEERAKGETMRRELRSLRTACEAEKARVRSAQTARDRLQAELEELRRDTKDLEELGAKSATLQQRLDESEVELGAQLQKATSLQASSDRLRGDLEEAQGSAGRSENMLAEVQARLQQNLARCEQMQAKHQEVRKAAEAAKQACESLQVELGSERAAREGLEDQAHLLVADAERAERGLKSAEDALASAEKVKAELESRLESCRSEAQTLREGKRKADLLLAEKDEQAGKLRNAASRFTESTRDLLDAWARHLTAGGSLSELLPACGARCDENLGGRALVGEEETGAAAAVREAPQEGNGGIERAADSGAYDDIHEEGTARDHAASPPSAMRRSLHADGILEAERVVSAPCADNSTPPLHAGEENDTACTAAVADGTQPPAGQQPGLTAAAAAAAAGTGETALPLPPPATLSASQGREGAAGAGGTSLPAMDPVHNASGGDLVAVSAAAASTAVAAAAARGDASSPSRAGQSSSLNLEAELEAQLGTVAPCTNEPGTGALPEPPCVDDGRDGLCASGAVDGATVAADQRHMLSLMMVGDDSPLPPM